jgi:hypothetical protein
MEEPFIREIFKSKKCKEVDGSSTVHLREPQLMSRVFDRDQGRTGTKARSRSQSDPGPGPLAGPGDRDTAYWLSML